MAACGPANAGSYGASAGSRHGARERCRSEGRVALAPRCQRDGDLVADDGSRLACRRGSRLGFITIAHFQRTSESGSTPLLDNREVLLSRRACSSLELRSRWVWNREYWPLWS
jgi:hypothetical protein